MARDGIEPPTHGASIHCSTNWATEPYCGSRIWTYDLRVMSPTSYRAAPSRVNTKGGCGIRTHARFYTPDGFQDRSLQPDLGNPPINSPYGIRTRVTAVKRRCLNPLTNGPSICSRYNHYINFLLIVNHFWDFFSKISFNFLIFNLEIGQRWSS